MPANAVQVKPDVSNCPDNKTLVLSDDGAKLVTVEDYRGEVIYRVVDGQPTQINGLGTLSADVTLIKPETEEGFLIDQFDGKSKKWLYRKNFASMIVYSTDDGAPRTLTIDDRAIPDGYTDKTRPNDAYNWDAKKQDWVLDAKKQAEIDKQAAQAAGQQQLIEIEQAIQFHINQTVANLGMGFTDDQSLIGKYAGYDNVFRPIAEAVGKWVAEIWYLAAQDKAAIMAGKKSIPTVEEAIARIPTFVPPSAN